MSVCMDKNLDAYIVVKPAVDGTPTAGSYGLWDMDFYQFSSGDEPQVSITDHDWQRCTSVLGFTIPGSCTTLPNTYNARGNALTTAGKPKVINDGTAVTRTYNLSFMFATMQEIISFVYNPHTGRQDALQYSFIIRTTQPRTLSLDISDKTNQGFVKPNQDVLYTSAGTPILTDWTYPIASAPAWFQFAGPSNRNVRIDVSDLSPQPASIYTDATSAGMRLGFSYNAFEAAPGVPYSFSHTIMPFEAAVPTVGANYNLSLTAPSDVSSASLLIPAQVVVTNTTASTLSGVKVDVVSESTVNGYTLTVLGTSDPFVTLNVPALAPGATYRTSVWLNAGEVSTDETYHIRASGYRDSPLEIGPTVARDVLVPAGGPYYVAFGDSITTGYSVAECETNRDGDINGCVGANPGMPYPEALYYLRGGRYRDLRRVGVWGDTVQEASSNAQAGANPPTRGAPWRPQLLEIDNATGVVTGSLVINDMRFSGDFATWISLYLKQEASGTGTPLVAAEAERRIDLIRDDLAYMFDKLEAARLRGASVATNNYYNPFADDQGCRLTYRLSEILLDVVNVVIDDYAAAAGIPVADFYTAMKGHGARASGNTDDTTWVYATTCSAMKFLRSQAPSWMDPEQVGLVDPMAEIGRAFDPHPNRYGSWAFAEAYDKVLP
jgi:lysophospholipase L1-like esterase